MGKISFNLNEVDNGFHLSLWQENAPIETPLGTAGTANVCQNLVFHSMRDVMEALVAFVSDRL